MHDFRCVCESSGKANSIAHTRLPARLTNNLRIKGNLAIASLHARPKTSLSIRFPSQAVRCLAVSHTDAQNTLTGSDSLQNFPPFITTAVMRCSSNLRLRPHILIIVLKKRERERKTDIQRKPLMLFFYLSTNYNRKID